MSLRKWKIRPSNDNPPTGGYTVFREDKTESFYANTFEEAVEMAISLNTLTEKDDCGLIL